MPATLVIPSLLPDLCSDGSPLSLFPVYHSQFPVAIVHFIDLRPRGKIYDNIPILYTADYTARYVAEHNRVGGGD